METCSFCGDVPDRVYLRITDGRVMCTCCVDWSNAQERERPAPTSIPSNGEPIGRDRCRMSPLTLARGLFRLPFRGFPGKGQD